MPQAADFDKRLQAWLELKRELEFLHAQTQYLNLILKLGLRLQ